jgi:hypothetical protein
VFALNHVGSLFESISICDGWILSAAARKGNDRVFGC